MYGTQLNRFAIIYEADACHFVCRGHHAIYYKWSLSRLFNEVQSVYKQDLCREQVPYNKFIEHQCRVEDEEAVEFWTDLFPDDVESFPRVSSGCRVNASASTSISFSFERTTGSSVTSATILQAAWSWITAR